jgi:hypothetical protein
MKKLLILVAIICLATPAMAAEWGFYGQSRFQTWSVDKDSDVPGADSDRDTIWNQQTNTRIGAKIKFNDEIGGLFEAGIGDAWTNRQLYGTYNFGAGELLIGQTYTPTSSYFYSNSVFDQDGDLLGIGQFYVGRRDMIQLKFGSLKLAFVQPEAINYVGFDTDTTIPKIEVSYGFKTDMFFVDVYGGYQTYELDSTVAGVADEDADAYVVGLGGGVTFGPVAFKAGAHYGENLGNYQEYDPGYYTVTATRDEAAFVAGKLEDNEAWGGLAVLTYTVSDMIAIEAGYGYEQADLDNSGRDEDTLTQYYLQAPITITKGFVVTPEVGMIESERGQAPGVATTEPDVFYLGAKWQINF